MIKKFHQENSRRVFESKATSLEFLQGRHGSGQGCGKVPEIPFSQRFLFIAEYANFGYFIMYLYLHIQTSENPGFLKNGDRNSANCCEKEIDTHSLSESRTCGKPSASRGL